MTAPLPGSQGGDESSSAHHASVGQSRASNADRRNIGSPLKAIGWAFLGIRSSGARERDAAQVSPLVWIGVGIGAVVVFVLVLMVAVRWLVPAIS